MPIEYRSSSAMFGQVGFHFKSMVKCFFLGIGYFFQNRYFEVVSLFRFIAHWIATEFAIRCDRFDSRHPRIAAFFRYHFNMMVSFRRQLEARFATYFLIGLAVGQTPMILAAQAGIIG